MLRIDKNRLRSGNRAVTDKTLNIAAIAIHWLMSCCIVFFACFVAEYFPNFLKSQDVFKFVWHEFTHDDVVASLVGGAFVSAAISWRLCVVYGVPNIFIYDVVFEGGADNRRGLLKHTLKWDARLLAVMAGGFVARLCAIVIAPNQAANFFIVGAVLTCIPLWILHHTEDPNRSENKAAENPMIRGTFINTFQDARARVASLFEARRQLTPQVKQYLIRWAGLDLPGDTESHFGLIGINGSGKTLTLYAMLRSIIPTVRDRTVADDGKPAATAQRALVFDPENKLTPFLQELAGEDSVYVLNPFDVRSRSWDIAKDIPDLATAQELAAIFIPKRENDSQSFFQQAAAVILSATFQALFMKAAERAERKDETKREPSWTLRHAFLIATDAKRVAHVLGMTNQTETLYKLLTPTDKTLFNVLADVATTINKLQIVAALWDTSVRDLKVPPFTLRGWLRENTVLVFGRPTNMEDTMLALNSVLLKRASQLIRAHIPAAEQKSRGRTWVFLDELRNIGNLPGLDKLLTEGRSRGARVVITFQDIDGLREVYGEHVAEEIANQCDTVSYLRCRGTTAKWAAERLGRSEFWDKDFNTGATSTSGSNSNSSGTSSGTTTRKHITDAVLESELSGLPPVAKATNEAGQAGGTVQGWHVVTAIEAIFPTRKDDAWYPFEQLDQDKQFVERSYKDQHLRAWDDATDWDEIGIDPPPPDEEKKGDKKAPSGPPTEPTSGELPDPYRPAT